MRFFVISLVCLALAAPASAGMYKWTDKNGKIHFTDSLSQVPADQRNKKYIRKMESTEVDSKSTPASSAPRKHLGAKHSGGHSQATGIDKQRVNDLLRLNQKHHYNHNK